MKTTIKIKLEKTSHLKEYGEELLRWESEGGKTSNLNEILDGLSLPLNKGEVFEVLEGSIISEGNEFYYEVEIDKVSTIDKID